jgi:hypothetical protein
VVATFLLKFLIKQKVCQLSSICSNHFSERRDFSSNVALSMILLSQELGGEIIDKL